MNTLGFDLETTGTDTLSDRPVQVAMLFRSGGTTRVIANELVNPGMPISPGAAAVHGISDQMVVNAPDVSIAAWRMHLIAEQLKDDTVLVTFNGRAFDVPMIDRCFGQPVFDMPHVDVLQFARRFFPTFKGSVSQGGKTLGELYAHFLNKPLENAHDAAADVTATLDLLDAMRVKAGITLEDLVEDQRVFRPYAIMPLGKYMGRPIDEIPVSWARFMDDKELDGDLRATVDYVLGRTPS